MSYKHRRVKQLKAGKPGAYSCDCVHHEGALDVIDTNNRRFFIMGRLRQKYALKCKLTDSIY